MCSERSFVCYAIPVEFRVQKTGPLERLLNQLQQRLEVFEELIHIDAILRRPRPLNRSRNRLAALVQVLPGTRLPALLS